MSQRKASEKCENDSPHLPDDVILSLLKRDMELAGITTHVLKLHNLHDEELIASLTKSQTQVQCLQISTDAPKLTSPPLIAVRHNAL